MNALEIIAKRNANKEKKVQTILDVDAETGSFFLIESSTGKQYWWSIDQFEKDLKAGTKVMVVGSTNQFTSAGTDFSKLTRREA